MNIHEIISIGLYMLLMIGIGVYSYYKSTSNSEEFLIGGRKLGAAVTALSAGAADMSGWLLMGLPGAMYMFGFASSWIAIGLTIGAFLNYIVVAPRLRIYTEVAQNAITLPVFFENRFRDRTRLLKIVSSVVILIFFTLYTSAGMVSGGRLFESAFGMDYMTGLYTTSLVVVVYTFLGGFLAVSLTDFVQGTIMFIALIMMPIVIVHQVGGITETLQIINDKDVQYLQIFKGSTFISAISLAAWGLGYFGQPHILVRFMAIENVREIKKARRIGISWMIMTLGGAMLVGLFGIAYLAKFDTASMLAFDQSKEKAETIFIYLSRVLFHPMIGGFLLSAILAAVMSTISSQLLVTSSSMTEDIFKSFIRPGASAKTMLIVSRVSVLVVAVIAFLLSLNPNNSILNLVGYAWAGFGASFGPVILLSLLWKRTTMKGALAGMLAGGVTVLAWIYIPHGFKELYEIIPGFIIGFSATVIVSMITPAVDKQIEDEFDKVQSTNKDL